MVACCSSGHEVGGQVAMAQTDFGSPWPGLVFSLPQAARQASALRLPGKLGRLTTSQPLILALLTLPVWPQRDDQTGISPSWRARPFSPGLQQSPESLEKGLLGLPLPCGQSLSGHRGCCRYCLTYTSNNQDLSARGKGGPGGHWPTRLP